MSLVPLTEGGSIDLDDSTLDESVRTDKLVVGCVVDLTKSGLRLAIRGRELREWMDTHDSEDSGLVCGTLAAPGKVTALETECTVLEVSSTDTNGVHTLGTKLGAGGLTAELELSLLTVVGALSTRGRTFVPGGTGNTCKSRQSRRHPQRRRRRQF